MTEAIAQDMIRSYVDRILLLKEEAKAINDDIREVYAEAKGNGFDKTVLGKIVGYVAKRADKGDELAEHEALFDLYLEAYDGASRVHARARAEHEPQPQVAQSVPARPVAPKPEGRLADASPSTMQEGSEPIGAHIPDNAGSTPAPASHSPDIAPAPEPGTEASAAALNADDASPQLGGAAGTPHRIMSMTPVHPIERNGLKGFGFSVNWEDRPHKSTERDRLCRAAAEGHACGAQNSRDACYSCRRAAGADQPEVA